MDEHHSHEPTGDAPTPTATTGLEAVDAVLAEVERLDERPVSEHVAFFERAHEHLRRALDAPQGP